MRYSGRLRWGRGESPIDEPVHGQIGWLDRQWFPDYVGTYDGPLADHYGHERIQLSLSNGWQMALWRQFDRHRQDALVPFSGLTVTDPDGRTVFVDEAGYDIDITTYLRDPGEIEPLLSKPQMLAGIRSPIRYFFDAYRLRVPSLGLDVSSIPMVPAPAHTMPVDYFNGPTQLQGTMAGQPVRGYGFHERTLPLSRPRELLVVLRDSLLHLPPGDVDPPSSPQHLADLAWQAKPLIDEDKRLPAASYVNSRVRP